MATNPYAKYAPSSRGVVLRDPYREAEEERKAQDQTFEARRLGLAESAADRAADAAARAAAAEERARLEWEATHEPDGTPKPEARPDNPDRIPQIKTLLDNISRLRELAEKRMAVGSWSEYFRDNPLLGQNRRNIEGAIEQIEGDLIQQQIAVLAEANHGKGVATMANSETEARRMAASIANLNPAQDAEEFLIGVQRAEDFYLRQAARARGLDVDDPALLSEFLPVGHPRRPASDVPMPKAAGSGASEQSIPIPDEMQEAHARYLQQNWGRLDPQAYANFRSDLDRQFEFEPRPDEYAAYAERANEMAAQGIDPATQTIGPVNAPLEGVDSFMNDFVSHPAGTFLAGAANAGGFGIPSLMAGDQYDAMRDLNPISATAGEIGGAITGTLTTGAGLGALGGRVSNATVSKLLANPLTADMGYGAVYGATQAEDPVYGALGGAGSAAVGNFIGGQLARRVPALVGMRRPNDTLGPGERRVFDAVERTGVDPVVDALMNADELGVPATLADVSSDVGSLAGAALRRSPAASGEARQFLGNRSAQQFDRFTGAVERDLGPIESIPQRSADLLESARQSSAPLYDAYRSAPGASSVKIDDLAATPVGTKALKEAQIGVQNTPGGDPTSLGFQFDEAGDVVFDRVPSFETLDLWKRSLDDIVEAGRNPITGKLDNLTPEQRAADNLRKELIKRIDAVNPNYAPARNAYAGPAAEREWMRRGERMLTTTPDQLAMIAGNATPEQLGQMQLGAQSELVRRAGDRGLATNPWRLIETPNMESRLASLYPEGGDNIARLLAQRDLERQLAASTNRLVGNSMTAERGIADEAFGASSMMDDALPMVVETSISGAPWATGLRSVASRLSGQGLRDMRTLGLGQRATQLADEIVPIALNPEPAASAATIADLVARDADYDQLIAALLADARERGGHVGAGIGTALLN